MAPIMLFIIDVIQQICSMTKKFNGFNLNLLNTLYVSIGAIN